MEIIARVEGSEEVAHDLRALARDVGEPEEGLEDIARHGAENAARLAPRLTGETARSIRPTSSRTEATIEAPSPAGPINYKTNSFMDTARRDLDLKATDLMDLATPREIERNM